jgi:hypothetical protein
VPNTGIKSESAAPVHFLSQNTLQSLETKKQATGGLKIFQSVIQIATGKGNTSQSDYRPPSYCQILLDAATVALPAIEAGCMEV